MSHSEQTQQISQLLNMHPQILDTGKRVKFIETLKKREEIIFLNMNNMLHRNVRESSFFSC